MSELTSEKMGPVKLSEIAQKVIGQNDKSKQDLVRLTIEKSLLKCGLVEKLRYAPIDESQQPTCPHDKHILRATTGRWSFSHSSQLFVFGEIPSFS